jgi:cytidine deaminase
MLQGLLMAPYSKFRVGAAVRLESGRRYMARMWKMLPFLQEPVLKEQLGCRCFNFPDDSPVAIAITAITENGDIAESVSPCGKLQQVIARRKQGEANR